jgi:hypothetical protein
VEQPQNVKSIWRRADNFVPTQKGLPTGLGKLSFPGDSEYPNDEKIVIFFILSQQFDSVYASTEQQ